MDIAFTHDVHPNEILTSVWYVVDLVNSSQDLKIEFHSSYEEQEEIAADFKAKS